MGENNCTDKQRVQELGMERRWFSNFFPSHFNQHLNINSIHWATAICALMGGIVSETRQRQVGHSSPS